MHLCPVPDVRQRSNAQSCRQLVIGDLAMSMGDSGERTRGPLSTRNNHQAVHDWGYGAPKAKQPHSENLPGDSSEAPVWHVGGRS